MSGGGHAYEVPAHAHREIGMIASPMMFFMFLHL
jgi:hypothetical protein